ncbi:sensor histidine kinase [Actinomadura logoneensis]|uniref:sensor histidine kinase n=1 Tax=Actinomadura logoneensis TaxID=2293572 RepID=UPI001F20A411|nr:ATP-binding protein [Actinomadura logoneensis]
MDEDADGGRLRRWFARVFISVRGRATVITVVMTGSVLALSTFLAVHLLEYAAESTARRNAYETLQRVIYDATLGHTAQALTPRPGEPALIQVVQPDGRVTAASAEVRGRPPLNPAPLRAQDLLIGRRACPSYLPSCVELVGMRIGGAGFPNTPIVYVAATVPSSQTAPALYLEVGLAALALLLLMSWWTWQTIGGALQPVERIRRQLSEITGAGLSGLSRRVPEPHTGGEIQRLAVAVNAALEQLEKASNRERRFVSEASHDLRNPIAGLLTRLEVALDEPDDLDWRPVVHGALRDANRLNDIVVDLLELARLDSPAPGARVPVELAGVVRREVEGRPWRVPIETRLTDGLFVLGSPIRLSRVLGNLLSNAERHAETVIEVLVRRDGDEAVVEVRDDGAGIPPEARERVFERFARLAESRRRDPSGTGLGLPIAREIARLYGGDLEVADSPGGARLVMRLPLTDPPPDPPPTPRRGGREPDAI